MIYEQNFFGSTAMVKWVNETGGEAKRLSDGTVQIRYGTQILVPKHGEFVVRDPRGKWEVVDKWTFSTVYQALI